MGHPDTIVDHQNEVLHIILQEREGHLKPWALRQAKIGMSYIRDMMDDCLSRNREKLGSAGTTKDHVYGDCLAV